MQPLTVFIVQLLYTVKEKVGKPGRKPYPIPYGLRNPYRNLTSENYQDFAQQPHQNCTFMNSASGCILHTLDMAENNFKSFQGIQYKCTDAGGILICIANEIIFLNT